MSTDRPAGCRQHLLVSVREAPRRRDRAARPGAMERCEGRILLAALPLGAAGSFAVLGGSAVTNTGPSAVVGDLGVSPGTAVTGFPAGLVTGGTIHAGDALSLLAHTDLIAAYNALAGEPSTADLTGQDLGGKRLTPGVYRFSSSAQLTGTLTLDAQGDPNARFDFLIGSTLTTASSASVVLINSADACNVNWQVGSSATLGTDTTFEGNILALTSITLGTRANILSGRALAQNGAVTLDSNDVSDVCAQDAPPPVTPVPPVVPPATGNGTPGIPVGGVTTPVGPQVPIVAVPAPPPVGPSSPAVPPVPRFTQPLSPVKPPGTPPTVEITTTITIGRLGYHAQPTTLVLSFGSPLDPARALDVRNYRVVSLGGPGRGGSRVGHVIGILSAVYDPVALTVTLRPAERLDVHNAYRLTVKGTGPTGLAGATGLPLGLDFAGSITRSTLVGPAPGFAQATIRHGEAHPTAARRVTAKGVDVASAGRPGGHATGPRQPATGRPGTHRPRPW